MQGPPMQFTGAARCSRRYMMHVPFADLKLPTTFAAAGYLSCAGGAAQLKATNGFNQSQSNVLRMLGYFSLVGLQRVHALVGDYNGAMKAIVPLNLFDTKTLVTQNIVGALPARSLVARASCSCTEHSFNSICHCWRVSCRP